MIRTNLRPDLSGRVLHLCDADVLVLPPGGSATISLTGVFAHDEVDRV